MLIEFLHQVTVDKVPMAENIRLNIQPQNRQLRLKLTHVNGDIKTPLDIVIFNWTPKLDKLSFAISIYGKELTTNKEFLCKISYDILKQRVKFVGDISGKEVKSHINSIKDILDITKYFIN